MPDKASRAPRHFIRLPGQKRPVEVRAPEGWSDTDPVEIPPASDPRVEGFFEAVVDLLLERLQQERAHAIATPEAEALLAPEKKGRSNGEGHLTPRRRPHVKKAKPRSSE